MKSPPRPNALPRMDPPTAPAPPTSISSANSFGSFAVTVVCRIRNGPATSVRHQARVESRQQPLPHRIVTRLLNYFFRGLIILAPAFVTIYVFWLIISAVDR